MVHRVGVGAQIPVDLVIPAGDDALAYAEGVRGTCADDLFEGRPGVRAGRPRGDALRIRGLTQSQGREHP
ncbi:hypothetical protein [Nesterenkonia pannonica]|uniref:hypothetical protein n=1 Tax=Nesterenkonia pannonica TaxID=1548602 RepID=UPI00216485A6|nr:hypothetical protein [Nesterenkonia pannonica]